jgi:hypothetical protein
MAKILTKKRQFKKGSEYRQDLGLNYNPGPEDDILINSFKYEPEAKVKVKVAIPIQRRRQKGIVVDKIKILKRSTLFWKRLAAVFRVFIN